jgi:hypothetical protein
MPARVSSSRAGMRAGGRDASVLIENIAIRGRVSVTACTDVTWLAVPRRLRRVPSSTGRLARRRSSRQRDTLRSQLTERLPSTRRAEVARCPSARRLKLPRVGIESLVTKPVCRVLRWSLFRPASSEEVPASQAIVSSGTARGSGASARRARWARRRPLGRSVPTPNRPARCIGSHRLGRDASGMIARECAGPETLPRTGGAVPLPSDGHASSLAWRPIGSPTWLAARPGPWLAPDRVVDQARPGGRPQCARSQEGTAARSASCKIGARRGVRGDRPPLSRTPSRHGRAGGG